MDWKDSDKEIAAVQKVRKGKLPDRANFPEGRSVFRIVSKPKFALVHWLSNVKRRVICPQTETVGTDAEVNCLLCKRGDKPRIRYFAYIIRRPSGKVELWEFSRSVKEQIAAYAEQFGDPTKYDTILTRKGTGPDTNWIALPANKGVPSDLTEAEKASIANLPDLDKVYKVTQPDRVAAYLRGEIPSNTKPTTTDTNATSEDADFDIPADDQPF
jgi:hypothetical protein